jgi:hypothetical protein
MSVASSLDLESVIRLLESPQSIRTAHASPRAGSRQFTAQPGLLTTFGRCWKGGAKAPPFQSRGEKSGLEVTPIEQAEREIEDF